MIVVVDNYDSFTYNLVQYLEEVGARVEVVRNDELSIAELAARDPAGILLSPGPGRPDDAGITLDVVRTFAGRLPIFGVCLGHQAIAQAFGGAIVRAAQPMHGRLSAIRHRGEGVFEGLPDPFAAMRYHSLVVDPARLSPDLVVTAWTEEGEIMGLRHRALEVEGVQFHPESFLTEHGHALLARFVARAAAVRVLAKTVDFGASPLDVRPLSRTFSVSRSRFVIP